MTKSQQLTPAFRFLLASFGFLGSTSMGGLFIKSFTDRKAINLKINLKNKT